MARWIAYAMILIAAAIYISMAVRGNPLDTENVFRDAEVLCLEQNWDAAQTELLTVLRAEPMHPGAHFYLGRTYMFGSDFRPIMAEGEFLTALALFQNQSNRSRIERFPADYFEMMCYVEAAKANLAQISVYAERGAPLASLQKLVEDCFYYAGKAQTINPRAQEVQTLFRLIEPMRMPGSLESSPVTLTPEYTV